MALTLSGPTHVLTNNLSIKDPKFNLCHGGI